MKTCLLAALLLLYIFSLGRVGFGLDPDEPRYASIGRDMDRSGDWITPRLYGAGWFEKPPLLYWMTAAATRIGLRDEWAARLPVALLSLAFLVFFYFVLEREFNARVALIALAILGTSAGWLAYSFASVTDLPMSTCFSAAMLVAIFDTRRRTSGWNSAEWISPGFTAGVLLGFAILAKAFLPIALFAPVWLIARGKRIAIAAGAVLIAAPWHLLVWLRNGPAFWDVYFWQQQVGRFNSPALHHGQPFWFYVPVLLLGLFPWTPLFGLLARRQTYEDVRVSSLAIWLALAVVFLSVFANKLPGYLLSLLPAVAIVLAVALDKAAKQECAKQEWWIAACALALVLLPSAAAGLPDAFLSGATKAKWLFHPAGLLFVLPAAAVWWMAWKKMTALAVLATALTAAAGIGLLETQVLPVLDRRVSVRPFWREQRDKLSSSCLDPGLRPASEYGLAYYDARTTPKCSPDDSRWRVSNGPNGLALEAPRPQMP